MATSISKLSQLVVSTTTNKSPFDDDKEIIKSEIDLVTSFRG